MDRERVLFSRSDLMEQESMSPAHQRDEAWVMSLIRPLPRPLFEWGWTGRQWFRSILFFSAMELVLNAATRLTCVNSISSKGCCSLFVQRALSPMKLSQRET